MSRRLRFALAVPIAVIVLIVGGTWFYIHVIEGPAPKKLSFASTATTVAGSNAATTSGPFTLAGNWKVVATSTVGYRIKETLFGQSNTAVGRTTAVTGDLVVDGTTLRSTTLTADMTQMSSDRD